LNKPPSRRAFLSVGSNLGDRMSFLRQAVESLPDVMAVSPVYETAPVGGPDQGSFLNIIVELATDMNPLSLLGVCHRIESNAERVREQRWGPRTLDVDIIWMGGAEMETERLTIPHPRWMSRRFVLAPLRDLAPDLVSEDDIHMAEGSVTLVGEL
jgi:2-amino-4-hydroxy-6-hydroxymethyldihydropteridine diphosphokinase